MPYKKGNSIKAMVDGDSGVARKVAIKSVGPKTPQEKGVYASYLEASKGSKKQADRLFKLGKKHGFDEVARSIGGKEATSWLKRNRVIK